ncbi:MAG TPA: hypothetical protein VN838_17710 [Bradyrhizobium sp.]|nr:hypothetical protein [Bradyrhizobium sp.]
MAIVVEFPSRFNESRQEPLDELHGRTVPGEVIVFPRMNLAYLRRISEAVRAERERQNVV